MSLDPKWERVYFPAPETHHSYAEATEREFELQLERSVFILKLLNVK